MPHARPTRIAIRTLAAVALTLTLASPGVPGGRSLAVGTLTPRNYLPLVSGLPCDQSVQLFTNPGFEGSLGGWQTSGMPVVQCDLVAGGCSAHLAGTDGADDQLAQSATIPLWAETGALYVKWKMVTDDSSVTAHDYLTVTIAIGTPGSEHTTYHWATDNTGTENTWFRLRIGWEDISSMRGDPVAVRIRAQSDGAMVTHWNVDDVEFWFGCGSHTAGGVAAAAAASASRPGVLVEPLSPTERGGG
jgi:hypothetical protein